MLSCQQVRRLVISRGTMLDAGYLADDPAIMALTEIREEYRKRVGMSTYLSEMLGPMANCVMWMCQVTYPDGRRIDGWELEEKEQHRRTFSWLRRGSWLDLPYKIQANLGSEHVVIRYL